MTLCGLKNVTLLYLPNTHTGKKMSFGENTIKCGNISGRTIERGKYVSTYPKFST